MLFFGYYVKYILNYDSFKECINPLLFINLKYILQLKSLLFQLFAFKIYAIIKTVFCFNWLPLTSTGSSHWGVPWNQLKSENIEILYLLWALKELVQMDYKKACCVMEKHECQHSVEIFVKNIFNPFHGTGIFLYSLK